ncbi:ferredoxin--NADP reductase [Salinibacter altiplanensis]|uniref:ferredoxin--NADP reductase n=1 Tax=Salinibacter altiplanensis TaxID=1803181 RepID=UPI000C9F264B|nr:FAD-binding oxidoreductase [Salinibacter altiplanensis]
MASTFDATFTSIHQMTPRVKQYLLRVEDHTFSYRPGQHTVISFEQDGETVKRPYTPVNLSGTDTLALAIKRYEDGAASTWMAERSVGDALTLTELKGNLHLRDLERDTVFLSTGTGITPMVAMLKQYLREGTGEVAFLYGERTQEDIMFRETLDHLSADHDNLRVLYSLSHENWSGPTGHVQTHLDEALGDAFDTPHYYVCGIPPMVVDTEALLQDRGVDEDRIFTEGWEANAV